MMMPIECVAFHDVERDVSHNLNDVLVLFAFINVYHLLKKNILLMLSGIPALQRWFCQLVILLNVDL